MKLADELDEFFEDTRDVVVKEPLKFKAKLGIGEKAYKFLRSREKLTTFNEALGIGATASGIAASGVVASTFFASSGIVATALSAVGLGAAAVTPIGWVLAAGVITGGAYAGVSHIFERSKDTGLIVVPKFINTPLDVLAVALIEMMLPVSLKIASAGGGIRKPEVRAIREFFVDEWGYCPAFVAKLIEEYKEQTGAVSYSRLAESLGKYCAESPDCDKEVIMAGFVSHLREVIEADGVIHEDEMREIEYLSSMLIKQSEQAGGSLAVSDAIRKASQGISETFDTVSRSAAEFGASTGSRISRGIKAIGRGVPNVFGMASGAISMASSIPKRIGGLFKRKSGTE